MYVIRVRLLLPGAVIDFLPHNCPCISFQVDPLFQQQAAAYDDGGTVELRLNRLRTHSKFSELLQDSSTPLFRPRSEISSLSCCARPCEILPSLDSRFLEAPLCLAFDDFHFNKVEGDVKVSC